MTDQELRDFAADHIYYELLMLHETAMGLKSRENLDADFALKNAFIESFTIHARVLAQFLYYSPSPKFPDDVTAERYMQDVAAWKTARGSIPAELQEGHRPHRQGDRPPDEGATSSPRPEEGLDHR